MGTTPLHTDVLGGRTAGHHWTDPQWLSHSCLTAEGWEIVVVQGRFASRWTGAEHAGGSLGLLISRTIIEAHGGPTWPFSSQVYPEGRLCRFVPPIILHHKPFTSVEQIRG
jgi:hypothetical protein